MRSESASGKGRETDRVALPLLLAAVLLALTACGTAGAPAGPPLEEKEDPGIMGGETSDGEANGAASDGSTEETAMPVLKMRIDGNELAVVWEENESVRALTELAAGSPVAVEMSMYGGFEQVGPIGTSLPRNDAQTTTAAGDIVLYAGDQIVVFYGSNTWAYTRLGRIDGVSGSGLAELLGSGPVELVLFTEEGRP